MIYVDHSAVPIPEIYLHERTRSERDHVLAQLASLREEDRAGATGLLARARQSAASGRIRAKGMFAGDYLDALLEEARPALWQLFHGKCAYCETSLESIRGASDLYQPPNYKETLGGREPSRVRGSADLYRPREGARGADGASSVLHYSWLAFEWENTLLGCAFCLRAKGSRFPVGNIRAALGTLDGDALAAEHPLLLNPCADFPLQHMVPDLDKGLLIPFDERGAATIEVLNLNRGDLIEARRATAAGCAEQVRAVAMRCRGMSPMAMRSLLLEELRELVDRSQPYLMVRLMAAYETLRSALPELAEDDEILGILRPPRPMAGPGNPAMTGAVPPEADLPDVDIELSKAGYEAERARQQSYSIEGEGEQSKSAYFTSAKRIERFRIRNFKAIEELHVEFPAPDASRESWLMLLGENGCGKSSILQALALTLMGEEHANSLGLDARRFVRRHPEVAGGEVTVEVSGVGQIRMEFSLESDRFRVDPPDPKVLLLGYGATRLLPKAVRRESSTRTAIRILNLFDPTAPLADTEAWLLNRDRVSDEQLEQFSEDLSRLLMLPEDTRLCRDTGQIELEYNGGRKVLRDMSDGFQSIIALAGDISIGVQDWWGGLRAAEGVVLLDEIEVHLHPTWKISIVERLRQTCPLLSFVVTTHDPLCLKGLRPEEIVVMRRTPEQELELVTDIPRIDHLRSDQLLSSFLFNLDSTRDSGAAIAIARYATLMGKPLRSVAEERELEQLRLRLAETLTSSVTPMQRQIEEQILSAISPQALQVEASPERLEILRQLSEVLQLSEVPGPKEPERA